MDKIWHCYCYICYKRIYKLKNMNKLFFYLTAIGIMIAGSLNPVFASGENKTRTAVTEFQTRQNQLN